MKIYNINISKLSAFLKYALMKLRIRSVLTLVILFVYQSLFAQVAELETGSFAYSDFLIVMLIILVATIFIGMEILDDPKYESPNPMQNKSQIVSASFVSTGYFFDTSISAKLKIGVYSTGLLLVIYAVLVFLMF